MKSLFYSKLVPKSIAHVFAALMPASILFVISKSLNFYTAASVVPPLEETLSIHCRCVSLLLFCNCKAPLKV
jgi:cellobiose-specific phosphotransferase system component IIC